MGLERREQLPQFPGSEGGTGPSPVTGTGPGPKLSNPREHQGLISATGGKGNPLQQKHVPPRNSGEPRCHQRKDKGSQQRRPQGRHERRDGRAVLRSLETSTEPVLPMDTLGTQAAKSHSWSQMNKHEEHRSPRDNLKCRALQQEWTWKGGTRRSDKTSGRGLVGLYIRKMV